MTLDPRPATAASAVVACVSEPLTEGLVLRPGDGCRPDHLEASMTETTTTETADAQIERLAEFIAHHVPGEPSQSEGAVDTAIRLLGAHATASTAHPVPCQDCGSVDWPDWTLLPHRLFNATCPGGDGYLCLPCFCRRVLASAPDHVVTARPDLPEVAHVSADDKATPKLRRDMTYAEAYGDDAARMVESLAEGLRKLADRIEHYAVALRRGDGKASSNAASAVSELVQGLGNSGTHLWSLVHAAGQADRHAAEAGEVSR